MAGEWLALQHVHLPFCSAALSAPSDVGSLGAPYRFTAASFPAGSSPREGFVSCRDGLERGADVSLAAGGTVRACTACDTPAPADVKQKIIAASSNPFCARSFAVTSPPSCAAERV
ncbi:hypothetical protein GCM10025857_08320 [Alicyclobacillus contaminans]|nr:hypothetical protein GCM10025857_08320 [Alicyclobacillus contaminans]